MVVVGAPGAPHCPSALRPANRSGETRWSTRSARSRRAHRRNLEREREARMVVEHGERMAAAAAEQGEVALEVHLPQFVGRLTFETLERALSGRGGGGLQPRAAQNASHGARRQHWTAWHSSTRASLRPPPRVARFAPQPDHRLFDFSSGARGTAPGPLGAVFKTARPHLRIAHQPLVAGLRRDPEAPAQLRADYFPPATPTAQTPCATTLG